MTQTPRDGPPRAVLAFDNTGTLSRSISETADAKPGVEWAVPVPEVPPERALVALLSIDHDGVGAFATDRPLAVVLEEQSLPLYLALSNIETTLEEARETVVDDRSTPARIVSKSFKRLADRLASEAGPADPSIIGTQIVVDLSAGRTLRAIAYTAIPLPGARGVIEWAREDGHEPHIVSGDTPAILGAVADAVGVDRENVHPFQSPEDKARTVAELNEQTGRPVAMVGDYVNDRLAFEAAEFAVFVDTRDNERIRTTLCAHTDADVSSIDDLREVFEEFTFAQ